VSIFWEDRETTKQERVRAWLWSDKTPAVPLARWGLNDFIAEISVLVLVLEIK
jgi:hypothetical protein